MDKMGNVIYHPKYKTGTNLYNLKTPFGSTPIQTEISTAFFYSGGGFVENMLPVDLGSDTFTQRVSFVKKVDIHDWYIGCSFEEEQLSEIIKSKIIHRIETVKFNNDGHYYIINAEGKGIKLPGNKSLEGKDLTDISDSSGVYYYKNLLSYALQKK